MRLLAETFESAVMTILSSLRDSALISVKVLCHRTIVNTAACLPHPPQVKNKAPAEVQITAEQLLREAKERELEIVARVSTNQF